MSDSIPTILLVPFLASWQSLLELSSSFCPATGTAALTLRVRCEFSWSFC